MTDIVGRLCGWASARPQLDSPQYLMTEAADEIERLRGLLRECLPYLHEDCGWSYDEPTGWLNDRVEKALGDETT